MSTYRLTFDIEIPDISEDDSQKISDWLDHFIGCIEDDIYSCHPLNDCDVDVNSNWKKYENRKKNKNYSAKL